MKPTVIVVALPLEDDILSNIHHWAEKYDWAHVEDIYLVHIVKQVLNASEFGMTEVPDEKSYQEMIPSLESFLRTQAAVIVPHEFVGRVHYRVEKAFDPEEEMTKLLSEIHADVLVVGTRGKNGIFAIFDRSFSQYMVKHAPCDVLVVRPDHSSP